MNKIDWTKPIETTQGYPATLLSVLKGTDYPYLVVIADHFGNETAHTFGELPSTSSNAGNHLRNVAPPLCLYGRLEERWGGDIEGMAWTHTRGKSDTHVMKIPADRLNEFVKPL